MTEETIAFAIRRVLESLPPGVTLVAAVKSRTVEQVRAAIRAGLTCIGHNYVQDAEQMRPLIPEPVRWHLIGHLQTNKVRVAVPLFDMIETADSWRLAQEIDRRCAAMDKVMPVLAEVNSGREANKSGVLPEGVDELVRQMAGLPHLHVQGLMTMGPSFGNPEDSRPFFRTTHQAFERLKAANVPGVEMRYLSMGMSNSYQVALEEGANVVRLGTRLFGERSVG